MTIVASGGGYTGPRDLIFEIRDGSLIIADRGHAMYAAQLWDALASKTWAGFWAKLPSGGLEEFLELFAKERGGDGDPVDSCPTGDEPFDSFAQDDYPEWLARSMFSWLPEDLIEGYAMPEVGSDGYFPADAAEELFDALRARGCVIEPSAFFLI